MLLTAKTGVEQYEIIALLGARDTGEVYGTWETRLERTIAVKISGVPLTYQFEREARVISDLKIGTVLVNRT